MNIDQLKAKFPNENVCRQFFESVIWQHGRICPHCKCQKSYAICGASGRPGLYECAQCKRQFTVTTKTPMQHQAAVMEVAVSDVLYDPLKQRHFLGNFGQMGRHLSKKRLETWLCDARDDGLRF